MILEICFHSSSSERGSVEILQCAESQSLVYISGHRERIKVECFGLSYKI